MHLNRVHLLERVVQDTRSINRLEPQVLVVEVTHKQTLGGKGIGLNIDVGPGYAAQEARLAHIGVSADEKRASVGVDGRQTAKMLANLVEVEQRVLQALDKGGHATKRSLLELLALEERLAVLEQTDIVTRDCFDEMLGRRELAKGNAEMVGIVKGVEQILVERVDVLKTGETLENCAKLVRKRLLRELDLSRVEA